MKRNLNLDLVRSTAIILVFCQHFLLCSGVYDMNIVGAPGFIMCSLRVVFMSSIPLFLMLSGYLCCKKQFSFNYYLGLVRIYIVYLLSCAACLIFKFVYMGEKLDIYSIVFSILTHKVNGYSWYVAMYTGLFLMIPFLNAMYNSLPSRHHKKALLITLIYLVVIPTICNISLNLYHVWWKDLYPLLYYFLGIYIGEYKPKFSVKKGFLFLVILVILFGGLNYWLCHPSVFIWAPYNYYDGLQTVMVSILIFIMLLNIDLSSCSKTFGDCIERISLLSFSIYMFAVITDTVVYDILRANVPSLSVRLWFIPITVLASFLLSFIIAWLVEIPIKIAREAICGFLIRFKCNIEHKYFHNTHIG